MPEAAGRPTLVQGDRQLLYGGMGRLSESSIVSIKNKSHAVTAEIEVPEGGAQGVIIAQGGSIGGWSLYLKEGKPRYCYNLFGIQRFYVDGDSGVPAGTHQVRMEFDYAGQDSARAETSPCTSTASRAVRERSPRRLPSSSPPTTPATWARRTARSSLRTTRCRTRSRAR